MPSQQKMNKPVLTDSVSLEEASAETREVFGMRLEADVTVRGRQNR